MDPDDKLYRFCVGIILLNRDNHIFVGKRIDNPIDAWQMPQGGINKDETPKNAAKRELQEETGIANAEIKFEIEGEFYYDLPAELRGNLWKGKYIGQRQKWFIMRFTGDDSEINITGDNAEFSDWKWIKPIEAPKLIVDFKKKLYEEIIEILLDKIGKV